jgi:hypothetical protein
LYENPPDAFMSARTEAVAEARSAGDAATAKQIAALRKPTVAAWLVNLLALRRPELVDELVELSGALRTAQRNLRGDQLRELSTQRRQAVSALVAHARRLALAAQPGLSPAKLPLSDVESTLTAALADEEVAALVRTGRLVRTLTYDGFGEVPKPRLRLLTGGEDDAADEPDEEEPPVPAVDRIADRRAERQRAERERAEQQRRAAARRAVEKELAAAEQAVLDAEAKAHDAGDAERQAVRTIADLEVEIAELERQRSAAQADATRRKLEHKSAQRAAAVARRRYGDVRAALDDLDR